MFYFEIKQGVNVGGLVLLSDLILKTVEKVVRPSTHYNFKLIIVIMEPQGHGFTILWLIMLILWLSSCVEMNQFEASFVRNIMCVFCSHAGHKEEDWQAAAGPARLLHSGGTH